MGKSVTPATSAALVKRLENARRELGQVEDELRQPVEPLAGADPVAIAARLCAARKLRETFFDPSLFAEPAWDLLLSLYVATGEDRKLTMTAAAEASGAPYATAHRWIAALEKQGLVARVPVNGKTVRLEMTAHGRERMTDFLLRMAALVSSGERR